MSGMLKLIRRFVLILFLSISVLLILNLLLGCALISSQSSNGGIWTAAETVSSSLSKTKNGFALSQEGEAVLKKQNAWAILISDKQGDVIWHSGNLPSDIPRHYTAADIARAVRGYIEDYPTTFHSKGNDLLILGLPKTSYWKLMNPTFDLELIANLPRNLGLFFICNLAVIFIIYMVATSGIFRSIKPILKGIETLPDGGDYYVKERGILSALAASINRSGEKLRMQERNLKKKETARANWIAGVSHDIRTPLSMIMGYAGQLEADSRLSAAEREKASVIRRQSEKIKNLINDLNLVSRLEYDMQPLHMEPCNMVSIARQIAVDFMNNDIEGKYSICWNTDETLTSCMVCGDKSLLARAITNLMQNCVNHNPQGCGICLAVKQKDAQCVLYIEDDGCGISEEQEKALSNLPHYMFCDGNIPQQRHGLGLLIVRRILSVHHGTLSIGCGSCGGFRAVLSLPLLPEPVEKK